LTGKVDTPVDRTPELQTRIRSLEQELIQERAKTAQMERGVQEIRDILTPLYRALRMLFGEMDAMPMSGTSGGAVAPGKKAIWESWKQKLGGQAAKAIDVLMMHGEMNRTQLRIHVGCATRTVTDIIYKLNQAGLINKNGGKISLKEL
jgi:hypothetical protein